MILRIQEGFFLFFFRWRKQTETRRVEQRKRSNIFNFFMLLIWVCDQETCTSFLPYILATIKEGKYTLLYIPVDMEDCRKQILVSKILRSLLYLTVQLQLFQPYFQPYCPYHLPIIQDICKIVLNDLKTKVPFWGCSYRSLSVRWILIINGDDWYSNAGKPL